MPSEFCTPFEWCSMPRAWKRKLVFAVPHHSAACISARCGTPVTSAVRGSVHSRQYSATCSKPTVCASMNA